MRSQFAGYFTPSEQEFTQLWSECIFAFDANVLLGLYRSTAETQEVFFTVLDKIKDRIFLPHQAASEYFRNRLNVISFRSEQYGRIKSECNKLANTVESIIQEHAILNGQEIASSAKEFSNEIEKLVDDSAENEPDLLRSDELLDKLAKVFKSSTGDPYPQERLKEVYAQGSQRYAQSIPPGYKDDKKGEPGKYGDLLIWFQLVDLAKERQKPIIFVTGDVKEDWLLQHKSETLGPRPELRQEMIAASKVEFWMYTTPRFLEFAKRFLGLQIDTKKAESEFEKIEKQDTEATDQSFVPQTFNYTYIRPDQTWPQWNQAYKADAFALKFNPVFEQYPGWAQSPSWSQPEEPKPDLKFLELLPINGLVYASSTGKWKCEIVALLESEGNDRACCTLKFEPEDRIRQPRHLKLWVSKAGLENDADWRYKKAISGSILKWLGTDRTSGEIGLGA